MEEELTSKMHSEFTVSDEADISHRVFCVVKDLAIGTPLKESLEDYDVTLDQYNKYRSKWE